MYARASRSCPYLSHLSSRPLSSVIPTFVICHSDRSEMIRNADRFRGVEGPAVSFPMVETEGPTSPHSEACHPERSEGPMYPLICHPDRSEMIRNADRFAEWRDLLFPSLWWKPKDLPTFLICHPYLSHLSSRPERND